MFRPSFETICMELAYRIAERSRCSRRSVGCVITDPEYNTIYSWGYNGNARGLENNCDDPKKSGGCGCLHAEDNAAVNSTAKFSDPKHIFVTLMPCIQCSKRLINLQNVRKVYFGELHKKCKGREMLEKSGIELIHFPIKK